MTLVLYERTKKAHRFLFTIQNAVEPHCPSEEDEGMMPEHGEREGRRVREAPPVSSLLLPPLTLHVPEDISELQRSHETCPQWRPWRRYRDLVAL